MAGTSESLIQTQTLHSLYAALDPKSLILSQFSDSDKPQFLQLTTDSLPMERGPRYKAYADLREKKLRIKHMKQSIPEEEEVEEREYNKEFVLTPPKKQVKFQGCFVTPPKRPKGSSILTQSVPDFSSALRKENRKPPPNILPTLKEKSATPPPAGSKSGKNYGAVGNIGGSKSVNSGGKRIGGLMTRKSYANIEELKGLASVARSAINGENRVGRTNRVAGKTVLGYRQL